jgi:hypothetical protein
MTEAELQAKVLSEVKRCGLWALTVGDSTRATAGWVDVFVLGRGALAVELKSTDGRRSLYQIDVAQRLARAGLSYRLWRPEDWASGTVTKELEALR